MNLKKMFRVIPAVSLLLLVLIAAVLGGCGEAVVLKDQILSVDYETENPATVVFDYDKSGNTTRISVGENSMRLKYDKNGQMVRGEIYLEKKQIGHFERSYKNGLCTEEKTYGCTLASAPYLVGPDGKEQWHLYSVTSIANLLANTDALKGLAHDDHRELIRTKSFSYDDAGKLVSVKNLAGGVETVQDYIYSKEEAHDIVSFTTDSTDGSAVTYDHHFEGNGELDKIRIGLSSGTNKLHFDYLMEYDGAGRLSKIFVNQDTGEEISVSHFSYQIGDYTAK